MAQELELDLGPDPGLVQVPHQVQPLHLRVPGHDLERGLRRVHMPGHMQALKPGQAQAGVVDAEVAVVGVMVAAAAAPAQGMVMVRATARGMGREAVIKKLRWEYR